MQNLDVLMKSVYTWTYVHWVPRLLFLSNICRIWWTGYIMIYQPSRTIYSQPNTQAASRVRWTWLAKRSNALVVVFWLFSSACRRQTFMGRDSEASLDAKTCWKMSKVKWCDVVTPCLQSLCRFLILQQGLLAYHAKNPVTVVNW